METHDENTVSEGRSAKTSLSVPHIRRAAKANLFPAPVKLSESRLGWLEEEIDAWLKQTVLSAREATRMSMHSITAAEFVSLEVPPRRYIFDPSYQNAD